MRARGASHTTRNHRVTADLRPTSPTCRTFPSAAAGAASARRSYAPAGSKIVSADYFADRAAHHAHLSGDESLKRAFARGDDVAPRHGAEVFGLPSTRSPTTSGAPRR